MLKQVPIALIMACGLLLPNCHPEAQTITTFPFGPPAYINQVVSKLKVSPEGDIWFLISEPPGLMRIDQGQLQYVYDTGTWLGDLVVAPDGTIYMDGFRYEFGMETGLSETGIARPQESRDYPLRFAEIDADGRMFCIYCNWNYMTTVASPFYIYELLHGGASYELRMHVQHIRSIIPVSTDQFWITDAYNAPHSHPRPELRKLDLDTREVEESYTIYLEDFPADELCARDCQGRLWMTGEDIVTFDGEQFSLFAVPDFSNREKYSHLSLAADGAVWAVLDTAGPWQIAQLRGTERRTFATEDGLLEPDRYHAPMIDYDGNVWIVGWEGISMISDGGWPPMRLMLHRVETEGTIAVEGQVINNGPVVGVDVYIALEKNGQLLYWPNWQPEPYPVQVNLRPGHNQTATIISAPRSSIPPGTYTFYACMTGRGTQKLIGPIDRKFESLIVEVEAK